MEFALVAMLLLLLMLGTIDVARAYLASSTLENATREAVRYAAAHAGEVDWQSAARRAGRARAVGIDPEGVQIEIRLCVLSAAGTVDCDHPPGEGEVPYVSATGRYDIHVLVPFVGALIGDPVRLSATGGQIVG